MSEAIIDIGFLDPKKFDFYQSAGFLGLKYDGKEYKRVSVRRALPHQMPEEFLSVCDHEQKEIGIIRNLKDLPKEQASLVREELLHRYFCPEVQQVVTVNDKMGYVYMEVLLLSSINNESYSKSFAVKDVSKNIRKLNDEQLIIFDVDGNRYLVPRLSKLDAKSVRLLEPYVF